MKKLWKRGITALLAAGMLASATGAAGIIRSDLKIEQRDNGFFFQAHTNRQDYKGLLLECRLNWLPEGLEPQSSQQQDGGHSVFYADQKGNRRIRFEQLSESAAVLVQSQKGDKIERVTVKGKPGGLISLAEGKGQDFNLIWYDTEAESYFSMLTHGLTREELFQSAESVDVRNKFEIQEIPGTGYHECPCGGTFWPFRRPRLQKTIDRESANQQGVKWVYSIQYVCDNCNWHIDLTYPAIPIP